ncbi:MAG: hypothetical protein NUV97_00095 [archaeon]|nr:hypothetical protein [archaeon]MCR4323579.1 hypothetical protein [Nanoarchaeota archaeon]
MKNRLVLGLSCLVLFLLISLVSADYSIDVSGLKESYSIGEKISYKVLLLEDGNPIQQSVEVIFSSDFGDEEIIKNVVSNEKNILLVEETFSSLGWHIKASYGGKVVERPFLIQENSEVEFVIEGNSLIIRNRGNVRYTRDVQIKIGDITESYTQNIPVGGEKVWKLVAPEGSYNIEITDGVNKFSKSNVPLTSIGTGNAIGMVSEDFRLTGLLGGPTDPDSLGSSFTPLRNYVVVLTFVGAVFILGVLFLVEKKLKKKKK